MDVDNFFKLLFSLYAEQEDLQIEYDIFFTDECFNQTHLCCRGTVS